MSSLGPLEPARVRKNAAADSTGRCNTRDLRRQKEVLQMKYRTRTYYSDSQKALMWERWKEGNSLQQIAQLFNRSGASPQELQLA